MNAGAFILLTVLAALALFLIQRTEAKRRRTALWLMGFAGLLTLYWANYRDLGREFWLGLLVAALLNFFFWAFIGRYNPVGSSDDNIQVIGMDD
jgi:hypothetical protein